MLLHDTTRQYQSALAGYCRSGKLEPIPGIHTGHISHYRRLVYNVVDDMLQNAYPLTRALLSDAEWEKAVNDFFTNHPCQSPQVWYMPKEFFQYLAASRHALLDRYFFLEDLLHFEWMEVEVFMMEDRRAEPATTYAPETGKLILNPEHQLFSFQYPVHLKPAHAITASDKGSYFLVAHRNGEGTVVFTDLSPALAMMLALLEEAPASVNELLLVLEREYGIISSESDRQAVQLFFRNALTQELIIF
jgi:hypothetical protein